MTGWPTGSPHSTPVGPSAPATPGSTLNAGLIFTSAKSRPIPLLTDFTVQPFGDTMHVPADTAVAETPSVPACGGAVPRQFGSIAAPLLPPPPPPLSKRTSTPVDPAA